jgi:hypothetical protein
MGWRGALVEATKSGHLEERDSALEQVLTSFRRFAEADANEVKLACA